MEDESNGSNGFDRFFALTIWRRHPLSIIPVFENEPVSKESVLYLTGYALEVWEICGWKTKCSGISNTELTEPRHTGQHE